MVDTATYLSKVTPFPTNANGGLSSDLPLYSNSTNLGGSSEPLATLRNENIFFCSAHARSLSSNKFKNRKYIICSCQRE